METNTQFNTLLEKCCQDVKEVINNETMSAGDKYKAIRLLTKTTNREIRNLLDDFTN